MQGIEKSFLAALEKYHSHLIIVKGSPDPDAIASAFAIQALCSRIGRTCAIIHQTPLSLPQNREFVSAFKIPLRFVKNLDDVARFNAYIVVDHQSAHIDNVSNRIPCSVHIDHHEKIEGDVPADFRLIDEEAGSTSSLVSFFIERIGLELEAPIMREIATALVFGIQTDTDRFAHAGKTDIEALHFLTRFSDSALLNRVSDIPLSETTMALLDRARNRMVHYKDWLIAGVGFVDQNERDNIAVAADFILSRESVTTVVVYAAVEDRERKKLTIEASFRTRDRHLNLNEVIKEITPTGGARKFKGAYQVSFDYFFHFPDRDQLWVLIEKTTTEIIKSRRDAIYITEIKGIYHRIRRKIAGLFEQRHPRR